MNRIEALVKKARFPIALTGAGISAPSGIPTFQGTWHGRPIRDFLSRDYFTSDRASFFALFCEMAAWCDKAPNAAHLALARWGIPVITQNIDGLHTRAGSKDVIEMHGTLQKVVCPRCGAEADARTFAETLRPLYAADDKEGLSRALRCRCSGMWDTDVVLYGDGVRCIDRAYALAEQCDLMLVIGTSLTTYPAAMLPDIARHAGARIVRIDEDCVGTMTDDDA